MFKALRQDRSESVARQQAFAHHAVPSSGAPAPVILAFPARDRIRPPLTLAEPLPPRFPRIEAWFSRANLAPDLAVDIGSGTWLRGLATLVTLTASAIALCPDFTAIDTASAMPLAAGQQDEYRSQAIAPLALGADSGRRMGLTPRVRPVAGLPERPTIQLVSTLGQGDTLTAMLERAGVAADQSAQVARLVATAAPDGTIAPGTPFDITLGKRPAAGSARALQSLNFRARFDLDLAVTASGGSLSLARRPIRVDETPLRIRGTVGPSLYRSARNAGAPVSAIQAYLQALDKYVSLESDLTAQDQFDMIVAYKRSARGERQTGDLLYAGVERGGKPTLQLLRWGKEGQMQAAGIISQPRSVALGMPVAGHITSTYGPRRHPILGFVRMHAGIDFGAAYGSPIYAVADGIVTFAGRHGGHGNYVRLQHAGGLGTGYGHMSRIAVADGTQVRAGQVIGFVGSTGLSTGPHLHFEAYRGGHTINPAGLAIAVRPQIDGPQRDAFKARLDALLRMASTRVDTPLGD
ncbi:M23 family metallopeptidase [Novosphingobium sp. Leaf2]|uniref:M23 family metallopeptidase n=1 Tax=Novosphingobium sp. Leaf2 TaxID=1735670 RepID=UPI0006FC22D0|nr:M23 family metallopeptidase [Novosphingobium sp. Leaf2]KQM21837.1 hypothetical protein ASE49_00500 [Novosphingobium sp. Leaf2]